MMASAVFGGNVGDEPPGTNMDAGGRGLVVLALAQ